jgi:hypothetical protein
VRPYRIGLATTGGMLIALGVFRLVTELASGDLAALALWLVVAVALHDGVIAPLTVGVGVTLTRLPRRVRRYVQGALVVGALITVVALPLIDRHDTQPVVKAILLRDYASNLALLLGLTVAVALVLYALRVLRDHGPPTTRDLASSDTEPET